MGRKPAVIANEISASVSHKYYTCSKCVSSCVAFQGRDAEPREKRKRKKPFSGHRFHWQLENKLKQRDAGTPFLSPFSSSSPSLFPLFSCCRQLVHSPKNFLEVMDFSGAGIAVEGIYHSRVVALLRPYISSPSLHCSLTESFMVMESGQSERLDYVKLVVHFFFLIAAKILFSNNQKCI